MSFGTNKYSEELYQTMKNSGMLFIVAAGNGDSSGRGYNIDSLPVYPASFDLDNVISVANLRFDGQIDPSSNFGAKSVDLEMCIRDSYTPNSQDGLARLPYRMQWEDDFLSYLKKLEEHKPVIFCGDLNVAHREIDLKNPKSNRKNAGFTDEERGKFTQLLESGFIDTYRHFYPDQEGIYSWWSYRFKAREKNAGWRIDYFCVSKALEDRLESAMIHTCLLYTSRCV